MRGNFVRNGIFLIISVYGSLSYLWVTAVTNGRIPCLQVPCWLQSLMQILLLISSVIFFGRNIFLCISSRHCSFMASLAEYAQKVPALIYGIKIFVVL